VSRLHDDAERRYDAMTAADFAQFHQAFVDEHEGLFQQFVYDRLYAQVCEDAMEAQEPA